MATQLALTFLGTLVALVWGTLICYYGRGSSFHRLRLQFIPNLWALIFYTGAFFGQFVLEEHYVVVYITSLMIAYVGWCPGYTVREAITVPAIMRLKRNLDLLAARRNCKVCN